MTARTSVYWAGALDGFVRYFERYAPWLPERIVGAPIARIEEAERLAGEPFPPEYRAFLRVMGSTPEGALDPFLRYHKFGIDTIEELHRTPGMRPPRDAVFLWTYGYDAPYDTFIETHGDEQGPRGLRQAGWAVDDETGALLGEEPVLGPPGGSLLRSLFVDAFLHLRDPLLPHTLQLRDRHRPYRAQPQLEADYRSIAERLGFAAVPFVDGDKIFYDRPDASLKLYAHPGANIVYAQGIDDELERIAAILRDDLGMAVWR